MWHKIQIPWQQLINNTRMLKSNWTVEANGGNCTGKECSQSYIWRLCEITWMQINYMLSNDAQVTKRMKWPPWDIYFCITEIICDSPPEAANCHRISSASTSYQSNITYTVIPVIWTICHNVYEWWTTHNWFLCWSWWMDTNYHRLLM